MRCPEPPFSSFPRKRPSEIDKFTHQTRLKALETPLADTLV
jgi:hypothetical protein